MAYERKSEGQTLLILGNFQKEPQTLPLPGKCKKLVLNNLAGEPVIRDGEISLTAWQAVVLEVE